MIKFDVQILDQTCHQLLKDEQEIERLQNRVKAVKKSLVDQFGPGHKMQFGAFKLSISETITPKVLDQKKVKEHLGESLLKFMRDGNPYERVSVKLLAV